MKHNRKLIIASLLCIILFMLHLADDIVRGFEPGTATNLTALPLFGVWLYGTLVLSERRSGYIIMLLFGLLSLAVPILHMRGRGVGINSSIAHTSGAFFFVWTLFALGLSGLFAFVLSIHGLWSLRRRPSD